MKNRIFVNSPILLSEFCRRKSTRRVIAGVAAVCMLFVGSLPALAGTPYLNGNAELTDLHNVNSVLNADNAAVFSSGSTVGVLDWSKYNIGANQSMTYNGPNTTFFNLVGGTSKSVINGMINGNGSVWVINPNGVAFGANAQVFVGGLFAAAAGAVGNADALRAGTASVPVFDNFAGDVTVADGATFNGFADFGDPVNPNSQVALMGKTVTVQEGAKFNVGQVDIAAAAGKIAVDEISGGKVNLSIADFATADDDINVTFEASTESGKSADFAGDLNVVADGSIYVKGAVKADGAITFQAGDRTTEATVTHKNMSVASGKYLQGKSVSASASGVVTIGGEGMSEAEIIATELGLDIVANGAVTVNNAKLTAGVSNVDLSTLDVTPMTGATAENSTLDITGSSVALNGATAVSLGEMTLTATAGDITVGGASQVGAAKDLTATAGGAFEVSGDAAVATKGAATVNAGAAYVQGGTLESVGAMAVTAADGNVIVKDGKIGSGDAVTVTATAGDIHVGGFNAGTTPTPVAGKVQGVKAVTLKATAGNVAVEAGEVFAKTENVTVTAGKSVAVAGTVEAEAEAVTLTANAASGLTEAEAAAVNVVAGEGTVAAGDAGVIVSGTVLGKTGVTVGTAGSVVVKGATVLAGDVNVEAPASTEAQENVALSVTAAKDVLVAGGAKVASSGTAGLTATAGDIMVGGASQVGAAKDLTATAGGAFEVSGDAAVATKGAATVNAGAAYVQGGTLESVGAMAVTAADGNVIVKDGKIGSGDAVTVTATAGDIHVGGFNAGTTPTPVAGKVQGVKAVTLKATAGNVAVEAGEVFAKTEGVTVTAGKSVAVAGTVEAEAGAVTLTANAASGLTEAEAAAVNAVAGEGTVAAGDAGVIVSGTVLGKGGVTVEAKGAAGSVIVKGANATVKAGSFTVDEAGEFVNLADSTADLTVTASGAVNIQGGARVGASGTLTVGSTEKKVSSVTVNGAQVVADGALSATASGAVEVKGGAFVGSHDTATLKGSGVIVDGAAVKASKGVELTASAGAIEIGKNDAATVAAGENKHGTVEGIESTVKLDASGAVSVANGSSVLATKDVDIDATGDVTISDSSTVTAKGDIHMGKTTAIGGKVDASGGMLKSVNADFNATGAVMANNADNDFTGTVTAQGTAVTLKDKNSISLGTVTATDGNVRIEATGGDVTIGADMSGKNLTVLAGTDADKTGSIKQNANVTANGTVDMEADGSIEMKDGVTTATTANGNISLVAVKGDVVAAKVNAGEGAVYLHAGNTATTTANGKITSANLAFDAKQIGTEESKFQMDVPTLALKAPKGIYVENAQAAEIGSTAGMTDGIAVKRVEADDVTKTKDVKRAKETEAVSGLTTEGPLKLTNHGTLTQTAAGVVKVGGNATITVDAGEDIELQNPNNDFQGTVNASAKDVHVADKDSITLGTISAGGELAVKAVDDIAVEGNSTAASSADLTAGGNIAFGANGQVKAATASLDAGGNITQAGSTVEMSKGVVDAGGFNAAVQAGKTTLKAGGNIGNGTYDYVAVGGGTVAATAGGDASLASAGTEDLTIAGLEAKNVSVYTEGKLVTDGTVKADGDTTVTAREFGGIAKHSFGGSLTVNNFTDGANPLLAIFKTDGGKKDPTINNQPNHAVIFIDGRLAGGDIQIINKLGSMEAFPVATPELKSEQGIFGNPVFLHDQLDVSNPFAVGAIDFLLEDRAELVYGAEFPAEADMQVAINGLSPTTSYRFGQNGEEGSGIGDRGSDSENQESGK